MARVNPTITLTALCVVLSAVMPLLAHHSVAAEYDMTRVITIQGMVTKVEPVNPHVRLWVETKNGDAAPSTWELELPGPNALTRVSGNKSRDLFRQGDQVSVTLWRAKDGTTLGHALTITFPDGRVMSLPTGWLYGGQNLTNFK